MGRLIVVTGGQYGSEAKGTVAAWLTRRERRRHQQVTCVRVAGPNAGHTVIDDAGREWKLRHVPTGMVIEPEAWGVIAAGSEIDAEVLAKEMYELETGGVPMWRLRIDSQATKIDSKRDVVGDAELVDRIGSTGKGVGSARARRIMREADIWDAQGIDTGELLRLWLVDGGSVVVEGTQGFGLGLHAGYYPQCTSSDCRAVDFLGMCGLSPWAPYVDELEVWVVLRTLPIRVAGNSGPMLHETSWEELGLEPEHTTVTNKVRRVGAWDARLAKRALEANGGPGGVVKVALTHLDQVGKLESYEQDLGCHIDLLGYGPRLGDYRER